MASVLVRTFVAALVLTGLRLPARLPVEEARWPRLPEQIAGHEILRAIQLPPHFSPALQILQDTTGIIWFGSAFGIYTYDETRGVWDDRSQAFGKSRAIWAIASMVQDTQARIWVEYDLTSELAYYRGGGWHRADDIHPKGIDSLGHALIGGGQGRIWFVSSAGLLGYDRSHWKGPFNPPPSALSQYGSPSTIAHAKLVSGEVEGGEKRGHADEAEKWTSGFWRGIEDPDGEVWLSGERATWRFDQKTGNWKVYSVLDSEKEGRLNLVEDNHGGIWFWNKHGKISRYDKQNDRWASYDISGRLNEMGAFVQSIWPDRPGRLIIGTTDRNLILDEESRELTPLVFAEPPPRAGEMVISAVTLDRQGRIWMACDDKVFVLLQ